MNAAVAPSGLLAGLDIAIETRGLILDYGAQRALHAVDLQLPQRRVTALIGPSGCGKTSLLRCFNRLNDRVAGCRISGEVRVLGRDAYARSTEVMDLRRRVGMVFPQPGLFPQSVADNLAYGLRLLGLRTRSELADRIEAALRSVGLWEELRDKLEHSAASLNVGQQQRLVVARALAVEPEVLLLDHPCSLLDPPSTLRLEELIVALRERMAVVLATHDLQQAARVADFTGYLQGGRLLEFDTTDRIFTSPRHAATEHYVSGRLVPYAGAG